MKKLALVALMALCAAGTASAREAKTWGLGVLIGEPIAITGEYQMTSERAIDMGLGYSWGHALSLYGDYLFQFLGAWEGHGEFISKVTPYVGVGAFFESHDSTHPHVRDYKTYSTTFGARIPVGADWFIPSSPVQLFVELVPALILVPGLDVDFYGGVGARYFF